MRVIFVGAVCLAKGVWNLLEGATLTQGITFRLAGQAADGFRLQLEAAIEKHGLRERFEILGLVPNDKVPGLMSDSDVFCLPSLEEGFPITVLEAMNCALPIVASRVGNIPEIIEHQIGGILFDPGDVHALVAALEKLRDEPELRRQMGSRNWKRAKECYDYEAFARKLVMIYQSVLNPAPRA